MKERVCDVAIIGAGTAGLAAERTARGEGAKTLLIDEQFAGTTCATVGCMPSKLLIAAAQAAHAVRRAPLFGVRASSTINGRAVMQRVRAERDRFVAATRQSFLDLPDDIAIRARARFTGETSLALSDGTAVAAKAIVIATGGCPFIPDTLASLEELLLTNENLFELQTLPRSAAVIGAGALGLELAQALARLGVEITVFDRSDTIAGLRPGPVADSVLSVLRQEMKILLGTDITATRHNDAARIAWGGAEIGSGTFDRVLVATGRPPSTRDLDLQLAGLACDEHGMPCFDVQTMQCGQAPIFIAGDVDAYRPVLHEASTEGAIAGRNAARFPNVKSSERGISLSIMFTDPPLGVVGEPPLDESVVARAYYDDQGRAKVEAEPLTG